MTDWSKIEEAQRERILWDLAYAMNKCEEQSSTMRINLSWKNLTEAQRRGYYEYAVAVVDRLRFLGWL